MSQTSIGSDVESKRSTEVLMEHETYSCFVLVCLLVLSHIYIRVRDIQLLHLNRIEDVRPVKRFTAIESVRQIFFLPSLFSLFGIVPFYWMSDIHEMSSGGTIVLFIFYLFLSNFLRWKDHLIVLALGLDFDSPRGRYVGQKLQAYWEKGMNDDFTSLFIHEQLPRLGVRFLFPLALFASLKLALKMGNPLFGTALLSGFNLILFVTCLALGRLTEDDEEEPAS